jgi:hypothetical protein
LHVLLVLAPKKPAAFKRIAEQDATAKSGKTPARDTRASRRSSQLRVTRREGDRALPNRLPLQPPPQQPFMVQLPVQVAVPPPQVTLHGLAASLQSTLSA